MREATTDDIADLVLLRTAVSVQFTQKYGTGPWTCQATENRALREMKQSTIYILRGDDNKVNAALTLSNRKPWAIDAGYFTQCKRPLYLTSMVVAPDQQRKGVGRKCIAEGRRIAAEWPADVIRLDAFDSDAGAGGFYASCGFREMGRVTYRKAPLIYYELSLG